MADLPLDPEECRTMRDVRLGVDALDAELIGLLARRFAYMRAAARIKSARTAVRDEPRKAEVVANAAALAEARGLPRDLIAELWAQLVEGCIAFELSEWDSAAGRGEKG
jgi:isochorismate pyruvate lyase